MEQKPEGLQYDENKLARYDLIPPHALEALACLYGQGAKKYPPDNWKKGISFRRSFASLMRHAWAWFRGESHCPENGQHHLIAVAWRAFTLYELERMKRTDCDDRPCVGDAKREKALELCKRLHAKHYTDTESKRYVSPINGL